MLISRLVKLTNEKLAGEILGYEELVMHFDQVIDDINQQLNANFPVFSDLVEGTVEYSYFPDRYLRSLVPTGAAVYFYITDEEGGQPPAGYLSAYREALFFMLRDYSHAVPIEYQDCDLNGTAAFNLSGHNITEFDPEDMRI